MPVLYLTEMEVFAREFLPRKMVNYCRVVLMLRNCMLDTINPVPVELLDWIRG